MVDARMASPPFGALTFYATVGDPHRFTRSAAIGSYFGLAPRLHQSGLTARHSRISRMGNPATRTLLVQAAIRFMQLRSPDCDVAMWVTSIEQRSGRGQSRIALARKIATIMLAMWTQGAASKPCLTSVEARVDQRIETVEHVQDSADLVAAG